MEELVCMIGGERKAVARLKRKGDRAEITVKIIKSCPDDKIAVRIGNGNAVTLQNPNGEKVHEFAPFALFIGKCGDCSGGSSKGYNGDMSDPFQEVEEDKNAAQNEEDSLETPMAEPDEKIFEEPDTPQEETTPKEQTQDAVDAKTDEPIGFEGEVASVNYYERELEKADTARDVLDVLRGTENGDERADKPYYQSIKPKLEELFESYPADEYLNSVIPSSRWVKIDYDGEGKSYSVGVLTDGEEAVYIGYGIRAHFSKPLPSSIKSAAQWVPLDFVYPKGEGYFMIYQNALDGSNV